jgi:hypothetical protein
MPSYQTPAGQQRMVDLTAPNGSASTIEAHSNPPSSNAHNTSGIPGESESPVLQLKRAQTDHTMYSETPGPGTRNLGILGRETYSLMSSPAIHHMEAHQDQGGHRWGGNSIQPPNATVPGPLGAGRADAARAPLTQRSGLGTVSVGSGLFGR